MYLVKHTISALRIRCVKFIKADATRIIASVLVLLTPLVCTQSSAAIAENDRMDALKAAYVYYFSKFITWESETTSISELNICIFSNKASEISQFNTLKKRSEENQTINIHIFTSESTFEKPSVSICRIFYVAKNVELPDRFNELLAENNELLTVTEYGSKFSKSIITFVTNNNKLGFVINRDKAEKNNMKISAKLLRLATEVIQHDEP